MKDPIIKKITNYMKERKLNQRETSSLLGVSVWTLNRWLKAKNSPSPAYRRIIEKHIN